MRYSKNLVFGIVTTVFLVTGCGKTSNSTTTDAGSVTPQATTVTPSTPVVINPTTPTTPTTGTGSAPLHYQVMEYGGSATFSTGSINTDNILQARFIVGPAGNQVFSATDVSVQITMNGDTVTPKYTTDPNCPAGGCEFGRPSDGPSNIIDFSGLLSPGVPATITISNAYYNWYCYTGLTPSGAYAFTNPCNYRLVLNPFNNGSQSSPGHYWSGTLVVATNATNMVQFQSTNP